MLDSETLPCPPDDGTAAPPGGELRPMTHPPISCDMVDRMKTTVELPDDLLRRAKEAARKRGTTLRALIETGLRHVLRRQPASERFVLRDASFDGDGLRPEFADGGWERLRTAIYEGRGG